MTNNFMEEFTSAYYDDPVRFVREMSGAEPYDYQAGFCVRWRTASGR